MAGACLFDLDGTLVNTECLWEEAENKCLARLAGKSRSEVSVNLLGGTVDDSVEFLIDAGADGSKSDIRRAFMDCLFDYPIDESIIMPGVVEFLSSVSQFSKMAVASNSPQALVDKILRDTGLQDFFEYSLGEDSVKEGKPEPFLYTEACRLLNVSPARSIAFEDSPLGATSARRAGLLIVGVNADREIKLDCDKRISSFLHARLAEECQVLLL